MIPNQSLLSSHPFFRSGFFFLTLFLVISISCKKEMNSGAEIAKEDRTPFVFTSLLTPYVKTEFRADTCEEKERGAGHPVLQGDVLVFNGAMDGNRQVDPQIAVGKNHVLHGTNTGFTIFDKEGNYIDGVSQKCFLNGIDPKLFYDSHHDVYGFDLWQYWDRESKPVHISISQSGDPTKGWNTYSVPCPNGVDGGSLGFSNKWVGYTFPGGEERTFVVDLQAMKKGDSTFAYFFTGDLGHPVFSQDKTDILYFFKIDEEDFVINGIYTNEEGLPFSHEVARKPHNLQFYDFPPPSPQKGTEQLVASGDRNPKNVILNHEQLWFSHTVNIDGHAGVQWHQLNLNAEIVQSGKIYNPESNYIQTSLAVNKKNDVLIGFQEVNQNMFISPRYALHRHTDEAGQTESIHSLGEGKGYTDGQSWGDYSGSTWDGGNFKDLWTVQSMTNENGKNESVIAKITIK